VRLAARPGPPGNQQPGYGLSCKTLKSSAILGEDARRDGDAAGQPGREQASERKTSTLTRPPVTSNEVHLLRTNNDLGTGRSFRVPVV
jgi:hypothetical protein